MVERGNVSAKRKSLLVVAASVAALFTPAMPASASTTLIPTYTSTAPARTVQQTVSSRIIVATRWPSPYGSVSGIAASVCKNVNLWPQIARANHLRAPYWLQVGQRVTVSCVATSMVSAPKPAAKPTTVTTAAPGGWVSPLGHYTLTSCYGPRWGRMHQGLDMSIGSGTMIRAARTGTVVRTGWWAGGYGISVLIAHGNGIYSHYAHMSRSLVVTGQRVQAGTVIGRVGSTGDSTGPHLHFEVWRNWWGQVNPAPWMRNHGVRIGC